MQPFDSNAVAKLAALVQRAVAERGDRVGFDADARTSCWLSSRYPVPGAASSADCMDAVAGRELVETLTLRMESGQYR